ncbi:hypothetical protein PFISCL1PPCAC_12759, partial [Pristionchus fissidentatus]
RRCLICSVPVSASHFGMDCCRACSSFFKRAKLSGKRFSCRQGDKQCVVVKDDKFMCRRCRFDRCLSVGMVYDGPLRVNKKLDAIIESSPTSVDSNSPSTSRVSESILVSIGREFNACDERRREQETVLMESCGDRVRAPHPTQVLYIANYRTSVDTYNICVAETLIFFREAFPTLGELSQNERDALFKGYIAKFSMIETHYRTRKIWGTLKRYMMGSVLICVDLECTDNWLREEDGLENMEQMLSSIRSYTNTQYALLLPILNKAQITSKEFHGLLALLLCEIDSKSEVSEQVLCVLDRLRAEIFEELQRYYKEEMGLSDFSTRLGELMTLNHAIRECNSLFQEFFRLHTTVFDLYGSEDMIKELF